MRRRLSILGCLAFVAAACGGGHGATTTGASSAEQWAGGICSAATTYERALTSAASAFTKNPSKTGIHHALSRAKLATDHLVTTLRGLGEPDTPSGPAARKTIDDLASTISSDVNTIQHAYASSAGVVPAITPVMTLASSMNTTVTNAIDELKGLHGGELKAAFSSAPSCAKLAGARG